MLALKVFVNEVGEYGNPVGMMVDEKQEISIKERQRLTSETGFSECVFINDISTGKISIYNPLHEVKFAGHALVGTGYFINQIIGKKINNLECKGGQIQTWQENNLTWIRASLGETPPWNFKHLIDAQAVEAVDTSQAVGLEHVVVWAWINEEKGIIRAKTFAADWGIPEDEANGSGSMQLAALTRKRVEIHHGKGSIIYANPVDKVVSEVGGRVKMVK